MKTITFRRAVLQLGRLHGRVHRVHPEMRRRHRGRHRRRRLARRTTRRRRPTHGQREHPGIVRAVHQENGGHGQAVNTGLANASRGCYFKVVDSDDWLDEAAMREVMAYLRAQRDRAEAGQAATDLVIGNYVYEKVAEGTRTVMHYRNVFPEGREFGWDEVGHFGQSQYLLMHSVDLPHRASARHGARAARSTRSTWTTSSCTCRCRTCKTHLLPRRGHVPLLHRPRGPERERERHDGPHRPAAARHAPA